MTFKEARQRAELHNASIYKTSWGDYRVLLNEWQKLNPKRREELTYYTDDIEDAALTAGAMRRRA